MGNNYDCFPLSPLRLDMVNSLKREFGDRFRAWGAGWGEDTTSCGPEEESNIYRGCKIAISLSHYDLERYFSDRMLRIMGCSTFCLAKWYPKIEDDFVDKKHLVVWNNIDDLIVKIRYYLENPFERFKIARCGFGHVYANHTWDRRLRELQYIIDDNRPLTKQEKDNDYKSQSDTTSASQSKQEKYPKVGNFNGSLKVLSGILK
jgi:glycosyltransferase involved in cell wall biosynthesis